MNNVLKTTIVSIVIFSILSLIALKNLNNQKMATVTPSPTVNKTFSLAMVAKHNTPDNCWLAIEGKVYDVTEFIASNKHPGGEAILAGCGKDATKMFNRRNDGTAHSQQARSFLPNYYLGNLVK